MDIFYYGFMLRALVAGIIIAVICPVLGSFIVVRRQSFIGDGLGHIAFAGVAGSYVFNIYPLEGALVFTILGALGIEGLRQRHSQYADMGLALVFYAGMALAIIFSTLIRIPSAGLLGFLFGSIITVSTTDVLLIAFCSIIVAAIVARYFNQMLFISLDEESAYVAGINTKKINLIFSILTALVVVTGISVVGVLLVSALLVIPVATAHHLHKSFRATLIWAVVFSLLAVICGLLIAYYVDIAPGGTIVIISIIIYILVLLFRYLTVKFSPGYQ